jgi:hypothetical protein
MVVRFALLLITAVALAQDRPDCESAARRLHSDSPIEKAWGANSAAECGLTSLASDIAGQFAQANPEQLSRLTWDSEYFWMAHAFLDALIRLRVFSEASALNSFAKCYPDGAIILMLQRPYDNQELLAWIRTELPAGAAWVAASNALARMRSSGFAFTLLHETAITHTIAVTEGEACCRGMAGSMMGGPLSVKLPSGFPPVHFYRLTGKPEPGDRMVADGPVPVYERHIQLKPGIESTMPGEPEGYCLQCLRIQYLSQLSGLTLTETELAVEPSTALPWSANLEQKISRAVSHQIDDMRRLSRSLRQSGALAPSEPGMMLHIRVKMEDHRMDKQPPLADFSSVKFILR